LYDERFADANDKTR
jgi:hypothetical protein